MDSGPFAAKFGVAAHLYENKQIPWWASPFPRISLIPYPKPAAVVHTYESKGILYRRGLGGLISIMMADSLGA